MNTLSLHAISRSIVPAARFFDTGSRELDYGGAYISRSGSLAPNPQFVPSGELREAIIAYARQLDGIILDALDRDADFDPEDMSVWRQLAYDSEPEEYWRRITALMLNSAEANGVGIVPGDGAIVAIMDILREETAWAEEVE